MNILATLIVGAIAGLLADYIVKGINVSFIVKVIVGVLGGLLGGWIFSLFGVTTNSLLLNILSALVGAIILLIVLRAIRHN
ncbi:MAG: GlsB/YeaQ/YmgE family stress response membrane protein [Anaerolineaceae bacterium]